MAITVDIGPAGRQLLKARSGRPLLGLDHKYFKEIFGDLLADVELVGEGDEIRQVKYSLVRHGTDVLDEGADHLGRMAGVADRDHARLYEAYETLDHQRRTAANPQVRAILHSFYLAPPAEDPFAFRIYRDPMDRRKKRLVLLWGTLPGTASLLTAPVDKHDKERALLSTLGGWKQKFRESVPQWAVWTSVAVVCLVLLLLFLRPLIGADEGDVPQSPQVAETQADQTPGEQGAIEDEPGPAGEEGNVGPGATASPADSVKEEPKGWRETFVSWFWDRSEEAETTGDKETDVYVIDETNSETGTYEGVVGSEESESSAATGTESSESADSETSAETSTGHSESAESESSEETGYKDSGSEEQGEDYYGGKTEEGDFELPGGDLYIVLNASGEIGQQPVVKVVLQEPPQITYIAPDRVSEDVWSQVSDTEGPDKRFQQRAELRSVWIPENEELLRQVDVASLTRGAVPSRLPGRPADRSRVVFYLLQVDENGRLVSKTPVKVDNWDK